MDKKLEQVIRDIESGDINTATFYELVDTYYQCVIYKIDEYDPEADVPEDSSYPKELLLPLADRPSGIAKSLAVLLDKGYDVDEHDDCFNALMLAVANGDEPMTAFLLEHGADPHTWPGEEAIPGHSEANYYLEDIDIHYMDACIEHDDDYKAALLRTAQTFVKLSGLKNFNGCCLLVDEDGNVSLEPPRNKY